MCEIEHGGRIGRIFFLCIIPNHSQAPSVKTPRSARTRVEEGDKREMRPCAQTAHGEARKKSHLGWMQGRVEAERDKSTIGEATSHDLQNPQNQGSL